MDYALAYLKLMANARKRVCVSGYVERHHVLPKSLGGSDDSSNMVALTAREHFVAHCLLARIHGGNQWAAVVYMKGNDQYINSRLYENARKAYGSIVAQRMIGNSNTKGRKASEEERRAMSESRKGKPGRPQSEETKEKLRQANIGKRISESVRAKLSASQKGIKKPDGHGQKIAAFYSAKRAAEQAVCKAQSSTFKFTSKEST